MKFHLKQHDPYKYDFALITVHHTKTCVSKNNTMALFYLTTVYSATRDSGYNCINI